MKIEFLYFEGCPFYKKAMENLKEALKELGLPEDFEVINIDSDEKARQYNFIGSPTIRINGKDLDQKAEGTKVTTYKVCRLYQTPQGIKGAPTLEMIKKAIEEAKS